MTYSAIDGSQKRGLNVVSPFLEVAVDSIQVRRLDHLRMLVAKVLQEAGGFLRLLSDPMPEDSRIALLNSLEAAFEPKPFVRGQGPGVEPDDKVAVRRFNAASRLQNTPRPFKSGILGHASGNDFGRDKRYGSTVTVPGVSP